MTDLLSDHILRLRCKQHFQVKWDTSRFMQNSYNIIHFDSIKHVRLCFIIRLMVLDVIYSKMF